MYSLRICFLEESVQVLLLGWIGSDKLLLWKGSDWRRSISNLPAWIKSLSSVEVERESCASEDITSDDVDWFNDKWSLTGDMITPGVVWLFDKVLEEGILIKELIALDTGGEWILDVTLNQVATSELKVKQKYEGGESGSDGIVTSNIILGMYEHVLPSDSNDLLYANSSELILHVGFVGIVWLPSKELELTFFSAPYLNELYCENAFHKLLRTDSLSGLLLFMISGVKSFVWIVLIDEFKEPSELRECAGICCAMASWDGSFKLVWMLFKQGKIDMRWRKWIQWKLEDDEIMKGNGTSSFQIHISKQLSIATSM